MSFTCSANEANPPPRVEWWRGSELLQPSSSSGELSNTLNIQRLTRSDLMTILTCLATNTNLTTPVTHTFAVDLNRESSPWRWPTSILMIMMPLNFVVKPKEVRIVAPSELQGRNLSLGERYEFVCQATGSRPPTQLQWRREPRPGGIGGGGQPVILEHAGETRSNDGTVTTSGMMN